MAHRVIDLSHPLDPATPVYPGYPPVEIRVLESTQYVIPHGRRALNSSRLSVGLHCGTHMDAPFHFFEDHATIDRVDLDQCVGETLLVHLDVARQENIDQAKLAGYREQIARLRKVVFSTGWAKQWGCPGYFSEHPVITADAAHFLIECEVQLVGVDFPSVDHPPFPVHIELLSHNVVILENLTNLSEIRTESFQLVALPLKITGRDASPARAVALEVF